jgi:hypothetical protein
MGNNAVLSSKANRLSEENIASIFRVKGKSKHENSMTQQDAFS